MVSPGPGGGWVGAWKEQLIDRKKRWIFLVGNGFTGRDDAC